MINNVRRQIYTVGFDGPPSNKIPAMAWKTKENVENIQKAGSLEMRIKYFQNTRTSLQRNASLLPVPQMGKIWKEQVLATFK